MVIIREIEKKDAIEYFELSNKLDQETIFRPYEPGERQLSNEEKKQEIERLINDKNSILLVAEEDNKLVGYLGAYGRSANRLKHTVTIGIGILQSHTGKGIGTKLFETLEEWAIENNKHRLELTVMENNLPGQALYKKMGFVIEGIKRDSMYVNGEYINDIYMSKLL